MPMVLLAFAAYKEASTLILVLTGALSKLDATVLTVWAHHIFSNLLWNMAVSIIELKLCLLLLWRRNIWKFNLVVLTFMSWCLSKRMAPCQHTAMISDRLGGKRWSYRSLNPPDEYTTPIFDMILPSHCLLHTQLLPGLISNSVSLLWCFRQWGEEKKAVWLRQLSGWSNHLLGWIHVCVSSKWSEAALQLQGWCVCPYKIFMGGSFSWTFWQLYAWKYIHNLSPAPQCHTV